MRLAIAGKNNPSYKHGHATKWRRGSAKPSKTYVCWRSMKDRCLREDNTQWKDYGGRGIKICKRWMRFENFLADMGVVPEGMTLGRINNDGNYTPSNCRWETVLQQHNNTTMTHWLTFDGETKSLADWARHFGLPHSALIQRINKLKWPVQRALTTPLRLYCRNRYRMGGIAHG